MQSIVTAFVVGAIALSPLAAYQFELELPVGVSVDRLLIGIGSFLGLICFFLRPAHQTGMALLAFSVLGGLMLFAVFGTIGDKFASRGLMTALALLYAWAVAYVSSLGRTAERWIVFAHVGVGLVMLLFSLYVYGRFFSGQGLPTERPFSDSIPFMTVGTPDLSAGGRFYHRATLPFSRPHDFGLTAGIVVLVCTWYRMRYQISSYRGGYLVFVTAMTALVMLSGSRSAIIPYLVAVMWLAATTLLKPRMQAARLASYAKAVVVILLLAWLAAGLEARTGLFATVYDRLAIATFEGHASLRLRALQVAGESDWFRFLAGYGPETFGLVSGAGDVRTSPHMTYGTILVELGALALFTFLIILLYPLWKWIRVRHAVILHDRVAAIAMIMFLLLANLFYDFQVTVPQWVVIGMLYGMSPARSDPSGSIKTAVPSAFE